MDSGNSDIYRESALIGDMRADFFFSSRFKGEAYKLSNALTMFDGERGQYITVSHCHSWGELHCVCSGHIQIIAGEHTYDIHGGEMFFIPAEIYHYTVYCTDEACHYALGISVVRKKEGGEELFGLFSRAFTSSCRVIRDSRLYGLFLDFREVWTEGHAGLGSIVPSYLTLIAFRLCDALGGDTAKTSAPAVSPDNTGYRLGTVEYFMRANMRNDITVKDMEKLLYLSSRQINRFFRENYRSTFHKRLTSIRMEEAKRLLRNTPLKTEEIASEVGFTSLPGFYRAFLRYTGTTPADFRSGRSG